NPGLTVMTVTANEVVLVHAQPRRRDRVDAVAIPEMNDQPLAGGLVVHPRTQTLEAGQRLGVALPRLFRMAPDDLLEAGVPGHRQASSYTPPSPSDATTE